MTEDLVGLFQTYIGLSEAKAKDTVKNAGLSKTLEEVIGHAKQSEAAGNVSSAQGMLLYHVASKIKPQIKQHLPFLVSYITTDKLDTELRLNAGLEFLLENITAANEIDVAAFDASGVASRPRAWATAIETTRSVSLLPSRPPLQQPPPPQP